MKPILHAARAPFLLMLALGGCASPPPQPSAADLARASFGARLSPFEGHPADLMVEDLGPPDRDTPTSDGGRMLVWERFETKEMAGKTLALDCKITALTDTGRTVTGVVGGGNTLFCARVFPARKA